MKQTQMYVCTLEEFILVDVVTLLCKLEVSMELIHGTEYALEMQ